MVKVVMRPRHAASVALLTSVDWTHNANRTVPIREQQAQSGTRIGTLRFAPARAISQMEMPPCGRNVRVGLRYAALRRGNLTVWSISTYTNQARESFIRDNISDGSRYWALASP